jgi:adenosylhomocysteine nucleosidase
MRVAGILTVAVGLALFTGPQGHATERRLDETPRIVVMSAYAPEWQTLLAATQDQKDYVVNGKRFVTGKLAGKDVLLFLSGISMVNAAMSTQQAIDRFKVASIVFSGIAGGVDPSLSIGDVVVADQWGEYLESVFARETDGKFTPPQFGFIKTPYPNFGMMFPNQVEVTKDGLSEPESRFWFPVDGKLLAVARGVANSVTLERCAGEGKCLTHPPKIVVGGNGVSGQAFVDNAKFRTYAFDAFKAEVLDMESAAAAHVAYANGVPFIAFRSLSDLAGGGEGENQLGVFFAMASANSAKVVTAFLQALPAVEAP